ncbi:MAG: hypothetical protein GX868_18285 [Actinobacteria bacterium]|nr:hypothetical protein [Actinomycetota bacterium]
MRIAERVRALLPSVGVGAAVFGAQLCWSWSQLHRDVTTDESFTFFATNGGLGGLISANRMDPAMSAYYVVAHLVARVFPDSIVALRCLTLVTYAVTVVVFCELARRRTRWWAAPLALVALGATPIFREAVVDARAAVPAAMVAVLLMLAVERLLNAAGQHDTIVWVRWVSVLLAVLALTHPSGVAASGVAWLALVWVVRKEGFEARLWAVGALGALGVAFLANTMQAGNIDGLVEPGFAGLRGELGMLWGGNALLAVVAIVAVAAVVAIDGRRSALPALSAVTSVGWTLALALAVPLVTIFIARYLVVACVLLALAAVTVVPLRWRGGLLVTVGVASIVSGAISHDRAPGLPSVWCSLADQVEHTARAGDLLVFPSGAAVTAVTACLGEARSDELLATVKTVPDIAGLDRTNPRTMWMLMVDAAALSDTVRPSNTDRLIVLRTHEPAPGTEVFLSEFGAAGGTCVDRLSGGQGLTVCTGTA